MTITDTVLWRVPPTSNFGIKTRAKTAHAITYGTGKAACGRPASRFRFQPTFADRLCRSCCCAIGEHAWVGEDPEHCQDCGVTR